MNVFKRKVNLSILAQTALVMGALCISLPAFSLEREESEKPKAENTENAAVSAPMAPVSSVFYLDCSHLVFDNFFEQELTRAERVTLLNANIEANVGNYEACRAAANESAQERMVNAGSVGLIDGGDGAELASEIPEDLELDSTEDTAPPASASRNHSGATGKGGTSTVCDAIKQGLAGAKTESEKAHFEKLKNDYGCQ
ncbi:hypothetical protein CWE13_08405 [Aliidiomarina shirensis]|uniref:Uncharacterized protein n=1 Tax=Aliidiomarina shirensis TaxID=1048642 RepID=A0A432WSW2_9GAMM|nr:hypothetical protein [Aliidiomarina shirensis]RUO36859.1 hypothetical protein CWE13_08405 [Aliidiomarina shirensis]